MAYKHGGNIRELSRLSGFPPDKLLDFSASINPLGPPDWLRPLLSRQVENLVHYPDIDARELIKTIADHFSVAEERVVVGNGSTELIYTLPRAFNLERVVIPVPAYLDYTAASRAAGLPIDSIPLVEEKNFMLDFDYLDSYLGESSGYTLVFLGQPNNPTGLLFDRARFIRCAQKHEKALFCVDEAFADFVPGYVSLASEQLKNVVVVRSFTKFYAIPGLRLGASMAEPDTVQAVRNILPGWSVNTFAQAVGARALKDREYAEKTRECIKSERERLSEQLASMEAFQVFESVANYLLIKIRRKDVSATTLFEFLIRRGIAIRKCSTFDGLNDRFFRIAVRREEENRKLVQEIAGFLSLRSGLSKQFHTGKPDHRRSRTPALMFQGTSSNVGKSIMTSAFCRILLQDGYHVAPFKAQNMSNNSFVTSLGGEMGRAQVVQAQACRIEADERMNPVLLKPSSDTGSQVILKGKAVKSMTAGEYYAYKATILKTVRECYDELAHNYEVIILEGAGSPGEVNLKQHDLVNMAMAEYAGAPVIIVGDIDRGGVFASFVGTMEVLSEPERRLVAGFLVNKFRGDPRLLEYALTYTQAHTGKPVLGVVPFIPALALPEEDSVGFKEQLYPEKIFSSKERVSIIIIDLPHISNFTDFDALKMEGDVELKVVRTSKDFTAIACPPDAIVIPGSKNVISDLKVLQTNGLAEEISKHARSGKTVIIGICGGFQMLGQAIKDPNQIESMDGLMQGLKLLDMETVFERKKLLKRVEARHLPSGLKVYGYEIHHGQIAKGKAAPCLVGIDGEVVGVSSPNGLVWGTYLHGVFDADGFRRWFIDFLRQRKSLKPIGGITAVYDLESEFNRLAEEVRRSVDMAQIYSLMGL
ncbi:MAG: cobyric acid synthase [Spirochaetota bacterium]